MIIIHDVLVWRDGRLDRAEVFYWRTAIGEEVDFVWLAPDVLAVPWWRVI
jgi:predicted AAA+ superfamily ATPase